MLQEINGLPAHVLVIHAVVVLVPLAALMLVAGAVWPAARARLGSATPVLALAALVLVPITVNAGEWLRNRIDAARKNPQISRHADLGRGLLPWVAGMFVLAVVVWALDRRYTMSLRAPGKDSWSDRETRGGIAVQQRLATRQALSVWVVALVAVLCLIVAAGAVVELVRVGDSGAQAAWNYVQQLPRT